MLALNCKSNVKEFDLTGAKESTPGVCQKIEQVKMRIEEVTLFTDNDTLE